MFLSFRGERVWEKRRRRFALPAQSKKGFGVRWEAERHTAFLSRTIPWGSLLAFLGVLAVSGTSLILSRLLLAGLSDFAKQMAAMPHHVSIAPGRSISCF